MWCFGPKYVVLLVSNSYNQVVFTAKLYCISDLISETVLYFEFLLTWNVRTRNERQILYEHLENLYM